MRKFYFSLILLISFTSLFAQDSLVVETDSLSNNNLVDSLVVEKTDSSFVISKQDSLAGMFVDSSVTFLFMGDIMGHDAQIESAYDSIKGIYDYHSVFAHVKPIISKADFAIANLEVTLAGPPFKGYPQFSSPDVLAAACRDNGVDAFVTANNHSCDRGKSGIIRTLNVLDSLGIEHTGTFRDPADRDTMDLLIFEKNGIRVGLLNYTYGTNGLTIPEPTIVNKIDNSTILADIEKSKKQNLDKLIVMVHWGLEYETDPNQKQLAIADLLFENGVDIIIGSHPHVLQPMAYNKGDSLSPEKLVVYSLGNYVSNQRTQPRDGGAMVEFTLTKSGDVTSVTNHGYYLTWVNKPYRNGKYYFEVVPCAEYEADNYKDMSSASVVKMKAFVENSRNLFNEGNINFKEIK